MGRFYSAYREAINCMASVFVVMGFMTLMFIILDTTAPRCWHEHRIVEWHGSFHEITIHSIDCPETEQ